MTDGHDSRKETMTTDHDIARDRIRDALAQDFLKRTELIRVDTLPYPAYAFDPDGWEIFCIFRHDCHQVGGAEYWAYHPGLDQVRPLACSASDQEKRPGATREVCARLALRRPDLSLVVPAWERAGTRITCPGFP